MLSLFGYYGNSEITMAASRPLSKSERQQKLRRKAVRFFKTHDVESKLETMLNEMFTAQPGDVYGYMVCTNSNSAWLTSLLPPSQSIFIRFRMIRLYQMSKCIKEWTTEETRQWRLNCIVLSMECLRWVIAAEYSNCGKLMQLLLLYNCWLVWCQLVQSNCNQLNH